MSHAFRTPAKSTFVFVLVAVLIVPLTAPLLPTVADATAGGFSCPLTPQSGRTIIDFPSSWDMRDDVESRRQFGPMPVAVSAGTYNVTLVSYDDAHPQGGTQPNEQWFMELTNGSSVVFTSDAISDIPDDEITVTEIVNTNVTLGTNATGVRVEHAYPKSAPTANSVIAVCAALDLVETNSECTKIEGGRIGENGTVTLSNGTVVTLSDWVSKGGGEWVGFAYNATGPISFTVKTGTQTYTVLDVTNGTWLHPEGTSGKAISNVVFCVGQEPNECELSITKEVDRATANIGDTLTYTVRFENTGDANCTGGGVKVKDYVDDRLTYLSETRSSNVSAGWSSDTYDASERLIRWNAHTLEPGETGWVSWKGLIGTQRQCGNFDILNTASITARELNNFNTWVDSNSVKTSVDNDCDEPVTCPLTPQPDRTIVEFPDDWRLRSDKTNQRAAGPMTLATPISAGDYNITLVSTDPSHPSGGTQPQEQWYLRGLDGSSTIFNSSATTDLPDSIITLAEKVDDRFTIDESFNKLMALHAAPKSAPTANSITPVCVAFDKLPEDPTITLVKRVVNDDGGTARISDFTLKVDSTVVISGTPLVVSPGTYTASEVNLPGYEAGNWTGDCNKNGEVTLAWGEHAVCEIENDDLERPTIKLIKNVVNDDGGVLNISDFTLRVDSTDVTSGVAHSVTPGTYTASEVQHPDYTASSWSGDCAANGTVTVGWGEDAVCTITNDDKPAPPEDPTITLVKTVVNNDGGVSSIGDFTLKVDATTVTSGVPLTVTPGTFTASEVNLPGYDAGSWSGDCAANGTVTVAYGDNAVCEITNDDIPEPESPTITLVKTVINNNGKTLTVSDFTLKVDSTIVVSGTPLAVSPGTYTASEVQHQDYNASSWGGDCAANGTVAVAYGDNAVCTITNDDKGGRGGSSPRLVIEKSVDPTFTNPDTTVTYTVVVTNKGYATAVDVTMTDTLPEPYFSYSDGTVGLKKTWSLGNLAQNESETTTFNVDVSEDAIEAFYTNTATAKAKNNGQVSDTAVVEVRTGGVLGEEFFPKLEIEKTVSPPFTTPGGSATYTIVVRNVGEAVAENVVIDDIMPKELAEVITGQQTLNWSIGDLIVGQEWSVTYEATVSEDTTPNRSYRNIASADADNADKVLDPADIEVREGEVLGFETIPETGAFDGAAMGLFSMTLTSLLGYGAITTVFTRRRNQGAEVTLKRLARRAR